MFQLPVLVEGTEMQISAALPIGFLLDHAVAHGSDMGLVTQAMAHVAALAHHSQPQAPPEYEGYPGQGKHVHCHTHTHTHTHIHTRMPRVPRGTTCHHCYPFGDYHLGAGSGLTPLLRTIAPACPCDRVAWLLGAWGGGGLKEPACTSPPLFVSNVESCRGVRLSDTPPVT